jgi:antirestriction protein ArdC
VKLSKHERTHYAPSASQRTAVHRDDHASYIATWLTVLKNDKRAIFSAAAHAHSAADYLLKRQSESEARAA